MKSRAPQLALCLLTLLAYSNSFSTGFALDNRGLILEDTRIRDASSENFANIFQHTYWWPYGESGLYRPLTTLSYLFNYSTLGNGTSPAGYHWINYLLHTANVLLLFALARRFLGPGWPAFWMAALWAVHPLLTESVTNIVGRADLLAGVAVLGGFLLYLKSADATGTRRNLYLIALSLVTLAGAFSKESAVTILGVVVLYEGIFWKQRRQGRALLLGSVAMLIPIQIMLYFRGAVLFASQPTNFPFYDNPITAAGFFEGRLTALKVVGKYIGLLVWPAWLSCDYSWAQIPLFSTTASDILWTLIALGAIGAAIFLLRRNPTGLFLAGATFLVFLPTSNLLFPIGTIMAERFMYLPAIALAAAIVAAASRIANPKIATAVLALIAVAYAARTWVRNLDWESDLTLANATVAVVPASYKSHLLLANSLFEADSTRNIDRVLAEIEKSIAILQPIPPELNNAGVLRRAAAWYLAKADIAGAGTPASQQASRRALEVLDRCRAMVNAQLEAHSRRAGFEAGADPLSSAPAEIDRLASAVYLKLGDTSRALDVSAAAIQADPSNADLYRQYAQSLLAAHRASEAITVLMEGVMLTMDPGLRQNVVQAYQSGGDPSGCALVPGQNGSMAINPRCESVHERLCAATVAAIQLRLKGNRPDLARDLKTSGVRDFGCPATTLDAAFGGK